jgi:hypothetical protein
MIKIKRLSQESLGGGCKSVEGIPTFPLWIIGVPKEYRYKKKTIFENIRNKNCSQIYLFDIL